jgi:hypothetical protein
MVKNMPIAAVALTSTILANSATTFPIIAVSQINARTIGSCAIYDPSQPLQASNALVPVGAIQLYAQLYQKAHLIDSNIQGYSLKFTQQPQYGQIKRLLQDGSWFDLYSPNAGYRGNDKYVAEVAINGIKFKVIGFLRASSDVMTGFDDPCRKLGLPSAAWKISD